MAGMRNVLVLTSIVGIHIHTLNHTLNYNVKVNTSEVHKSGQPSLNTQSVYNIHVV